jgi:dTDP-4-amino-4,6-dideoxygalactose transaminase
MINVTKSFLPPIEEYMQYVRGVWERGYLTNQGPLVVEFESKMKEFLGVKHFHFTNNGTVALQLAIRALDLKGEIITTPFSYVATTSSIVWENAVPVFVDIDPASLTIDPTKIEAAISPRTSAILATHVYGVPCATETIRAIASKHNIRVIYDAAHAFGVRQNGGSILNVGDASTLSFHATKLFHTVEGGAVITNDDDIAHRISYMRNFGHNGQEKFWGLGINGKNSELHAAMGLSNFPYINVILERRKELTQLYDSIFGSLAVKLQRPVIPPGTAYNNAYYPIVLESEEVLLAIRDGLNKKDVYPRRYFYPSLSVLPYIEQQAPLPVAISVAPRVLCLPLFHDLDRKTIELICKIVASKLSGS